MAGKNQDTSKDLTTLENTSEEDTTGDDSQLPEEATICDLPVVYGKLFEIPGTADENGSPQPGRSNHTFCTSSEDVLNVFNFDDGQEAFGYENSRDSEDSRKVVLVCGDLFRNVCKHVNTLASILLEPQNKVLLNNFMEEFNGSQTVPWVVGASLKHWASRLSLNEDSETGTSGKFPYLKTTQTLTGKGEVDDPQALDRLEDRVYEYLEKIDAEGSFNEAIQSLGFVVNYICDTIDTLEPGDDVAGSGFGTTSRRQRQRTLSQAYENIFDELREVEAEIQELQAEVQQPPEVERVREPAENQLLHRIAGFDSFMGIVEQRESATPVPGSLNRSHHSIFPLVFPAKSGVLPGAFRTPSKLSTISSKNRLESKVSLTLLASTSSRHGFQLTTDDNGNPLFTPTGSRTTLHDEGENSTNSPIPYDETTDGYSTSQIGEDIADEIVRQMSADPTLFALAPELIAGRVTEDQPDSTGTVSRHPALHAAVYNGSRSKTEATPKGGSGKGVTAQKPPPTKLAGNGNAKPAVTAGPSASKGTVKATGSNNNKVQPKNQGKGQSSSNLNSASKKAPVKSATSAASSQGGSAKTGKVAVLSPTPKSRTIVKPPTVAFGTKVEPKAKNFHPNPAVAKPAAGTTKKPVVQATPRKVEHPKIASGCRRIEFTKVKQTVSYRQLNKENLELLQAPVGHGASTASSTDNLPPMGMNPETTPTVSANSDSALLSSSVDGGAQLANGNLPEVHTAPASISNLTPGVKAPEIPMIYSTPSSANSSSIPSVARIGSAAALNSKGSLTYVEIHRHRKCLQVAATSQALTRGRSTPKSRPAGAGTTTPRRFQ